MSFFKGSRNENRTRFQKFATNTLKAGQIPKHVAFIMDGNRRYTRKNGISLAEGYQRGVKTLRDTLQWCFEFGVKEITVYAFSIENLKRPEHEKEILFRLFKKQLEDFFEDGEDHADEFGACIRIVGDWSYIPEDLKESIAEAMLRTRNYSNLILNVAFAYTSQNEIARGSELLNRGVLAGDIEVGDITKELLTDVLQVFPTNPVDLLIRTSDTHRLSDFLTWQSAEGVIAFIKHEWPELTFWDIWKAIFEFQRSRNNSKNVIPPSLNQVETNQTSIERRQRFLEKVRKEAWEKLEAIVA